tara:strand:+ start:223 stop:606 length:384 start_codon:yes stop_codon:yes gene_type:complete
MATALLFFIPFLMLIFLFVHLIAGMTYKVDCEKGKWIKTWHAESVILNGARFRGTLKVKVFENGLLFQSYFPFFPNKFWLPKSGTRIELKQYDYPYLAPVYEATNKMYQVQVMEKNKYIFEQFSNNT